MSHRQIDALLAESGDGLDPAARADLREGLGGLLVLVEDTAPAPSPELAALLGLPGAEHAREDGATGATDGSEDRATVLPLRGPARPGRPHERRLTGPSGAVTGAVVLAVATVGATGISAAANSLPAPLQRHVADLSRTYLPFDFPQPRAALDRDRAEGLPAPDGDVPGEDTGPDAVREPSSDGTGDRDRALRPARTAPDATVAPTSPSSSRTWTVRQDEPRRPSTAPAAGGTRSSSAGTPSSTTASRPTGGRDDAHHGRTRTRGDAPDGPASGATGSSSAADDGATVPRARLDSPPPVLLAAPRPGRPVPSAPAPEGGPGQDRGASPGKDPGKDLSKDLGKDLGNGPGRGSGNGPGKGSAQGPDTAPSRGPGRGPAVLPGGAGAPEGPDVGGVVDRVVGGASGSGAGG